MTHATPTALSQASDTVQPASLITTISGAVLPSKTAPTGTRTSKPAKRSKHETKEKPKKARMPKGKKSARPPKVSGYSWRRDGAGFELRKSVYEDTGTGTKKRRRPYVAHLSKTAFAEMKKRHRGAALEQAIAQWVVEHDK
jgi:hypothetical protein